MTLWQLLSTFPTAVPTVFLAVLLVYWLMSIIGLVDVGDTLHLHTDVGHGHGAHDLHDLPDLHTLAGYLVALGLGGVPLSVAASVLVFCTWLSTALLHQYVLDWVPTDTLRTLAGCAVLVFSGGLSIPVAARVLQPMRALFVKHAARTNESLVGQDCRITTQSVDQGFGRADVEAHGVSINIRVWAAVPNALAKGSKAIIIAYDPANQQYEVQAAPAVF
ncbi:ubiquinone biosynthesis protein [Massilia violaceinigra]|uniref:Ubiquinone biosynthesis protein n=1 Tax=Massilia violaceinigra TaxID=2045208 RepID=A0ABY4A3A4_9BURK|nr:ubiquinone biosynthesis protein [Massilia violaceinigra]UOD29191.1 ubiquinone biosynthesis protein [Massilia violaceinigra]